MLACPFVFTNQLKSLPRDPSHSIEVTKSFRKRRKLHIPFPDDEVMREEARPMSWAAKSEPVVAKESEAFEHLAGSSVARNAPFECSHDVLELIHQLKALRNSDQSNLIFTVEIRGTFDACPHNFRAQVAVFRYDLANRQWPIAHSRQLSAMSDGAFSLQYVSQPSPS